MTAELNNAITIDDTAHVIQRRIAELPVSDVPLVLAQAYHVRYDQAFPAHPISASRKAIY